METTTPFWRKCSACKKPIPFRATYYLCSVSTCNGQRTGYVFCSVSCFEAHLPGARHRDAGAVEKQAPATADVAVTSGEATSAAGGGGRRVMATVSTAAVPGATTANKARTPIPREILVVVSKVKDYIRARSEMNTSDALMALLSDRIRELCDEAIDSARVEGRKTVLDRDLKKK